MKDYICKFCGEIWTFTKALRLSKTGEPYYWDGKVFICPDCYDSFQKNPEYQFERRLLK